MRSLVCLLLGYCISINCIPLPCIDNTWTYNEVTGKCYKYFNTLTNYTRAMEKCNATESSSYLIRPVQLANVQEVNFLKSFMNSQNIQWPIWSTAKRISGRVFMYQPLNTTIDFSFVLWNGGTDSGDCIAFNLFNERPSYEQYECFERLPYVCEHYVKTCKDPPGNLNLQVSELPPGYPGLKIESKCKYGYKLIPPASSSRVTGSDVSSDLNINEYSCLGTRPVPDTTPMDPINYETRFIYSGYPPIECEILKCNISSIQDMKSPTSYISRVMNLSTNELVPLNSTNIDTFNKVLDISCPTNFYYDDRTVTKQVYCAVNETDPTKTFWKPYPGTLFPLPQRCNQVECLSLDADPTPKMMIKNDFVINYINGSSKTAKHHETFIYTLGDQLVFQCVDGFTSINLGKNQTLTCGSKGKWVPLITSCIAESVNVSESTLGNRYQSNVVEAKNSQEIGNVIMGLIIGFFVLILLIDTVGVAEDLRFLKSNILIQLIHLGIYKPKGKKKIRTKSMTESEQILVEEDDDEDDHEKEVNDEEVEGENKSNPSEESKEKKDIDYVVDDEE